MVTYTSSYVQIIITTTTNTTRAAFERLRMRPRILRDVSRVDTKTTVLGQPVDFPICLAPTGKSLSH